MPFEQMERIFGLFGLALIVFAVTVIHIGPNWDHLLSQAAHPTVPKETLVADINLDQLRPLFPLKILTALAIDQTTLGCSSCAVLVGRSLHA